jgi:3-oxoacyl-[acyl-carrier protein] reductase
MKTSTKSAIVTGASGGIGRVVAKRLASDGFAVAVHYAGNPAKAETVVTEIKGAGGKAIAVQADVAKPADIETLFKQTLDAFGTIDVVVHTAGIMPLLPISGGDVEIFDKVIMTNLRGTFLVLGQAAKHVPAGGRIIAFSQQRHCKSLSDLRSLHRFQSGRGRLGAGSCQ